MGLVELILSILGVVMTPIATIWVPYLFKQRDDLSKQLNERRQEFSKDALNTVFKFLDKVKNASSLDPKIDKHDIAAIKNLQKGLMLWGSNKTIKIYNQAIAAPRKGKTTKEKVEHLGDLLLALRRDAGNRRGVINRLYRKDVLRLFINDYDEYMRKR